VTIAARHARSIPEGAVLQRLARFGGRRMIRSHPFVELDGEVVARIDGEPLFAWADAATAAVDARIAAGDLIEEAVDDHDVRKHHSDGADLVEDVGSSKRRFPDDATRVVAAVAQSLSCASAAAYVGLRVC
jgi:hypothetical protein